MRFSLIYEFEQKKNQMQKETQKKTEKSYVSILR